MAFPDIIRGTNPYSLNYINQGPRPEPIPYYIGQTSITTSTLMDDRYNGIWIWIDSATDINLTFPNTLLAGFNCTIIQADAGKAFCIDENGNPLHSESGVANTTSQYSAVFVVHRNDGLLVAMWDGATGGGPLGPIALTDLTDVNVTEGPAIDGYSLVFDNATGKWIAVLVSSGADYFSTSETLTTGASPVSIDPTVFLTKIVSGGTAGTEVVNFDDYNVDQAGKPHLIVFDTQTDPADVISITGDNDILVSPFGPLANASAPSPQFPAVFEALTMTLNASDDGFVLTWKGANWNLVEQVGAPTVTTRNAFKQAWDGLNNGPSVLTQLEDNTYALVPDTVSPFLTHTVTASTDINNPTLIPTVPRVTRVHSAGNAGPSYITMQGVDTDTLDSTLITKVVYLETLVDPSDTVLFKVSGGNIANADGSLFTSLVLDTQDDQVAMYWDNVWITAPPTNATADPLVQIPIIGNIIQGNTLGASANFTVSIPKGSLILGISYRETAGHAVTGGIKIGTTSGGTEVVVAQAVGANSIGGIFDAAILLKMFSTSAAQTLYIQPVSAWNSAVVRLEFVCANVA